VLLLASRTEDPSAVLLSQDAGEPIEARAAPTAYGFYWTEGLRGLGWAPDAVPTLKGGSGLGIPSSPAVWVPSSGDIGTLDIRDAERLQGFPIGWTEPAVPDTNVRNGPRWRLVGNAVNVPVASWLARSILSPVPTQFPAIELKSNEAWPSAAFGGEGRAYGAPVSAWPLHTPTPPILDFLKFPLQPLSLRATTGFLSRMKLSTLRFDPAFARAVSAHVEKLLQLDSPVTRAAAE
jgi:DNA (cytosine-5)-methyltransferase 1